MANTKFQSKRPYLSLSEAIKEYECTVDDLLYEASIGDLTIYVLADNWLAEQIYEADPTKDVSSLLVTYSGPQRAPIPDSYDEEEFERQYQAFINSKDREDISIGMYTFYGSRGIYRVLYERQWTGHQPIAVETLLKYRKGATATSIEIDVNKSLKLNNEAVERLMKPKSEFRFLDALNDGKLFVMKADMDRLSGLSQDGNLFTMYDDPCWPEELGIAIAAWQNARHNYKDGDKPSKLIKDWLSSNSATKDLPKAAVERITTIANWDKNPGPAKKMDED